MIESSLLAKAGLAILSAALAVMTGAFLRYRARVQDQADARTARITALEIRMAELSTQVSPLWAAVQSKIAKDLTHPEPQFAEMDQLLRELEALSLTPARHARLLELLQDRIQSTDGRVTQDERESAMVMEIVMRKAIGEANELKRQA